jgi:ABC-type branched-subunit amino acid transport system substrate-binding protein
VPRWSENPWGTGIKGVTELVYTEGVWALIGAPDSGSAHLVEQVVAKARLPFVNPIATDRTANLANVPWIFSLAPGDHILAGVLAEAIASLVRDASLVGDRSLVIVSCTDHESRMQTDATLDALARLKLHPAMHLQFKPNQENWKHQLERCHQANPAAIILLAGPVDAAHFMTELRKIEPTTPVFGGPAMAHHRFIEVAGPAAEGVVFPLLWHVSLAGVRSSEFAQRFKDRFGVEPDYTAAYTYDAMKLLITAVDRAGLDRERIRDAIRKMSPCAGVTGTITWGKNGQNQRPVQLGTIRNGKRVPVNP